MEVQGHRGRCRMSLCIVTAEGEGGGAIPGIPVWTDDIRNQMAPSPPPGPGHHIPSLLALYPGTRGKRKNPELTNINFSGTRWNRTPGQIWTTVKEKVTSVRLLADLQSPHVLLLKNERMSLTGKPLLASSLITVIVTLP